MLLNGTTERAAPTGGSLTALERPVQALRKQLGDVSNVGPTTSRLAATKRALQAMHALNLSMLESTEASLSAYGYVAPPSPAVPPPARSPEQAVEAASPVDASHDVMEPVPDVLPPSPSVNLAMLGISSAGMQIVNAAAAAAPAAVATPCSVAPPSVAAPAPAPAPPSSKDTGTPGGAS